MRCKWCGENNIPWWRVFGFTPYDYCSSKCAIESANAEAHELSIMCRVRDYMDAQRHP